ncbi:MAG: glycoside hydrolase family 3 protein, partial [Clostridia bacterium]|nr:glycoside hydrolase family 3 protein [Clostridia bacterium]
MDLKKARKTAENMVGMMTVEEAMTQLLYTSPAINRLGIKEYNWWNEAAHGVARAGAATVFPQAIGLAATFDPGLVGEIGEAVSLEARAKYNKNVAHGDRGIYKGLTFWAPNINIFRDGRWGRGQETFGEDPCLTSLMAVNFIKGVQGDGEYLRAAACAKHFAVHSGPEYYRHGFDARVGMKDLNETYLPAFEHAVKAGVAGVMGAYNRTNGEPCCAHSYLMDEVLFGKWGFE